MKTFLYREVFRFFFDETDEYEKNIKDKIVGYMHNYNKFQNAYIRFEKKINALLGITVMDRYLACDIASDVSLRKLDNIKRNLTKNNKNIIEKIKSKKDELQDVLIELYAAYKKLSIHLLLHAAGDIHELIDLKGGIKHVHEKDLFSYSVFKMPIPKVIMTMPVRYSERKGKYVIAKKTKLTKNLTTAERYRAITINFISDEESKNSNNNNREVVLMYVKGMQHVGDILSLDDKETDKRSFIEYSKEISSVNKLIFEYNTKLDILEVTGYELEKRSVASPLVTRFATPKNRITISESTKVVNKFVDRQEAFKLHPYAIDISDRFITIVDFTKDYINYLEKGRHEDDHHFMDPKVDNDPRTISFDNIYETAKNIYDTYKTMYENSKYMSPKAFSEKKTELYYALNLFVENEVDAHFIRIRDLLIRNGSRMLIINRDYLKDMNKNPNNIVYNLVLHYIDKAVLRLKNKLIENNTIMDNEKSFDKNFFYREFMPGSTLQYMIDNVSPDGNDIFYVHERFLAFEKKSKYSEFFMPSDFAKNDKYIYLDKKTNTHIFSGFARTINMLKVILKVTNDEQFILDKFNNVYICNPNDVRSSITSMKDLEKKSIYEEDIRYKNSIKDVINEKRMNHKICQFNNKYTIKSKITKESREEFVNYVNSYRQHIEYLYKTNYFYLRGIAETNILVTSPRTDQIYTEWEAKVDKLGNEMRENIEDTFQDPGVIKYMFFSVKNKDRYCSNIHIHSKRLARTYMYLKYGENEGSMYDSLFALGYNSGKEEPPHNYFTREIKPMVDSEKPINEDEFMVNSKILRIDKTVDLPKQ